MLWTQPPSPPALVKLGPLGHSEGSGSTLPSASWLERWATGRPDHTLQPQPGPQGPIPGHSWLQALCVLPAEAIITPGLDRHQAEALRLSRSPHAIRTGPAGWQVSADAAEAPREGGWALRPLAPGAVAAGHREHGNDGNVRPGAVAAGSCPHSARGPPWAGVRQEGCWPGPLSCPVLAGLPGYCPALQGRDWGGRASAPATASSPPGPLAPTVRSSLYKALLF